MNQKGYISVQIPKATIFYIKGQTREPVEQGELMVLTLDDSGVELMFLMCGEFKIPLLKSVLLLKMEPGFYVFVLPGEFIGFQVEQADASQTQTLEAVLAKTVTFRVSTTAQSQLTTPRRPPADVIAQTILSGSSTVCAGIDQATLTFTSAIRSGGRFVLCRTTPNELPTIVDPSTIQQAQNTKMLTAGACMISESMVISLVAASRIVASKLGQQIGKKAPGMASSTNVNNVKIVANAGIAAAGQVLNQLSMSAQAVVKTTGDEVVVIVDHKYGEDAGKLARESSGVVQDVVKTAMNVRAVSLKGMARCTARETAKELSRPLT
eukprot:NODE_2654_length_1126_cov_27.735736_g2532_i0.p1 GENE.NODE_2654_length_1126_cov_27.735736_g2532_i0~~NODE_2654_length_1126_cov_27.735736_g2532_i0.p1  ORF type:complete len:342 (-),score=92.63 NODE_2654_length_1126_cov_27.735736_g2532_i0:101-1069(-)